MTINRNVTLNLDGHSLTMTGANSALHITSGTVTINGNGNVKVSAASITASSGNIAAIQASGGSVTVNGNVEVSATGGNISASSGPIAAIQASGGAQVSVTGDVKVSATGTTYGSGNISDSVAGVQASGENTIVNVSGGVSLSAAGNASESGKITADSGSVAGVQASGENTTVTVSGGVSLSANTIKNANGVHASGGAKVEVGSVTMTANAATGNTIQNTNGVEVSGNTTDKKTTVTVNGAIQMEATGFQDSCGIKEASDGGSTVTAGSVSIGTGTTSKDVKGVYAAKGGATITITGDVTVDGSGVIAGGGSKTGETFNYRSGSQVTVNGGVTAAKTGVKAQGGGVVTVQGDVTGSGSNANTAAVFGEGSGTISVGGSVISTHSTGVGVYMQNRSQITVEGNVNGGNTSTAIGGLGLEVALGTDSSDGSITVKGTVSGNTSLQFVDSGFNSSNLTVSNLPTMKIGSYDAGKMIWGNNAAPTDDIKQQILSRVQKYVEPVVIPTYAVTAAETEHGTVTAGARYAAYGSTVTLTAAPDEGYVLESLTVLDQNGKPVELTDLGDGSFSFRMPVGRVTVQAVFTEDISVEELFNDVFTEDYYSAAVLWAAKQGITSGVPGGGFAPHASCGRAQLITFLWRAAGCPVVNFAMDFDDVDENAYYGEAVRWAASLGIVSGYGNGAFGTDDTITREQVATILYRFAQSQGMDVSAGADTNILSFGDALEASGYAAEALQWAVGCGIMEGSGGNLMPSEPCTRAQIVTLLFRLLGA